MFMREENRCVICAADVLFASSRMRPIVLLKNARSESVQFGSFLVRKELLVRVPRGSLQRRLVVVGPDTLQIRFAPRRVGRRSRLAGGVGVWPVTGVGAIVRSTITAVSEAAMPINARNRLPISCLLLFAGLLDEMRILASYTR